MLPSASEKFRDIHLDVVGPLPEVKGVRYLLTAVDRFSLWTMAESMANQLTSTVAGTFIRGWIQHSGVSHSIITDRGTNFQSSLFQSILARLGCRLIHTTSFHPEQNGMVEKWHRRLKDALRATADNFFWVDRLPFVLLNHHVALKRWWIAKPCWNCIWH